MQKSLENNDNEAMKIVIIARTFAFLAANLARSVGYEIL